MTPEQLWDWSRRSDWKTALRQGWLAALRDQPDVRWIAAADHGARCAEALLPALLDRLSQQSARRCGRRSCSRPRHLLIDTIESMQWLAVVFALNPCRSN
jgi:hypothetical protein